MANNESYNGWTNYPTWNLKLWLDHDQGAAEYWSETAETIWEEAEPTQCLSKASMARISLSDCLKEWYEEIAEENNGQAGVFADLLGWTLSQVNWAEIADSLLEDIHGYHEAA